jgi:protein-disulfide isomerase
MEGAIEHLLHAYPDEVAVVFRHFPLSSHPNALHAAEMASCAETLGYFPEVHRLLLRVVTLEGSDPETLASDSGIPDPSEMRRCLDSGEGRARVEEDVRLGQDLEIQGVPSFILQGVLLGSAPDSARLVDLVRQKVDDQRASGSSPVAAIR